MHLYMLAEFNMHRDVSGHMLGKGQWHNDFTFLTKKSFSATEIK